MDIDNDKISEIRELSDVNVIETGPGKIFMMTTECDINNNYTPPHYFQIIHQNYKENVVEEIPGPIYNKNTGNSISRMIFNDKDKCLYVA